MPTPPGQTVFQVRIELRDVEPTVWRRLLVPGGVRLAKVNAMLQAAMGWTNSHLHAFTVGDERFGMCFDDFPENEIDEKEVTFLRAVGEQSEFGYEYDFGDGWEHVVAVEGRFTLQHGLKYAVCLAGGNACPPEDCGGAPGYEYLREALADPAHEDHSNMLEWLGGLFDPAEFDLAAANVELQRVR